MNIIMPEMGGYQTIEKIRQREEIWQRRRSSPGPTDKRVKGDGDKCFEAGLSGDLAKPAQSPRRFCPHLRMCCFARRDRT